MTDCHVFYTGLLCRRSRYLGSGVTYTPIYKYINTYTHASVLRHSAVIRARRKGDTRKSILCAANPLPRSPWARVVICRFWCYIPIGALSFSVSQWWKKYSIFLCFNSETYICQSIQRLPQTRKKKKKTGIKFRSKNLISGECICESFFDKYNNCKKHLSWR